MGENSLCRVLCLSTSFTCWKGNESCVDLQRVSQGSSGIYYHGEKLQSSNHLLEVSLHDSDLPWDVSSLENNRVPAACTHYQE